MEQARDSMINMNVDDLANLQGEMMGEVQTYEYDDGFQRQDSNQFEYANTGGLGNELMMVQQTQVVRVECDTQTVIE